MTEDHPTWARRIRSIREARGWSQAEAAEQLRQHSDKCLPEADNLTRRWKAWELGENKPGDYYAPLIAATLGTVTAALFPPAERTELDSPVLSGTGMETLEIVSRLQYKPLTLTMRPLRVFASLWTSCVQSTHECRRGRW
ncbi:MAG: helix-turn-helix domain-containing protein [Sciscionella sp.]